MKRWITFAALLATGCMAEAPVCDGQPTAECGTEAGIYEDRDGVRWFIASSCTDDWQVRCDPGGGGPGTNRQALCDPSGTAPTCPPDTSGPPHCIAIPCDGVTYYGPAHPAGG